MVEESKRYVGLCGRLIFRTAGTTGTTGTTENFRDSVSLLSFPSLWSHKRSKPSQAPRPNFLSEGVRCGLDKEKKLPRDNYQGSTT